MISKLLIIHRGHFGARAAAAAAHELESAILVHCDADDLETAIGNAKGGRAVVLMSDAACRGLDALASRLREAGITWTSVHMYPTMLRVGPLQRPGGVCYDCATRRYLSNPGAQGLARLEELLRVTSGGATEFSGVLATTVAMAVAEAVRQVRDDTLPAGYIRKIELIDHSMTAAVAIRLHGCDCESTADAVDAAPGARFHRNLVRDLADVLVGGAA